MKLVNEMPKITEYGSKKTSCRAHKTGEKINLQKSLVQEIVEKKIRHTKNKQKSCTRDNRKGKTIYEIKKSCAQDNEKKNDLRKKVVRTRQIIKLDMS